MTAPITSARVRELSAKATGNVWYQAGFSFYSLDSRDGAKLGECFKEHTGDAALIAALCSEPARTRIAKALDLLERVEGPVAELRKAQSECLANRTYLGTAPCPKCKATRDEGCRIEGRAQNDLCCAAIAALVGSGTSDCVPSAILPY